MKQFVVALLLSPCLAACSSSEPPSASPESSPDQDHGSLTQDELAKAVAVSKDVVADQGATISNASVIAQTGTLEESNTGHPCTSGRMLKVRLIGSFPHTVTTGNPVLPGEPAPDITVRAMNVTADAESGRACLIGVQTGENGKVLPLPNATILQVQ